ncbi:pilus assembly protein [uncultured Sulfitobacter sp.]|uniref:TadE/TadG family type IV pilus assembly protein n=1 Tax=uncultured Sulfitobacter sp. TaxID=191468 RepID=UPI0026312C60|nr:pilus assembly protein [uncultured Sulfitobacter sp.]
MITRLKNRLKRFRSEEEGGVYTLEFAVMMPVLCMTLIYGVELTTHANRQFQLERGLEVTTRIIRLNTGQNLTHADLKQSICDNAGGLDNCEDNMRLEMMPTNPREFASLPASPDCTNSPLPVTPVRGWSLGQQHELMLMRACYQYEPFMSGFGLGKLIGNGENGKGSMVAMSAFVQEPR